MQLTPTFTSADDLSAKKKFEEGIDALRKDDFSRALDAFEASYAIAPKSSVLYNIGMCQKAMFRYTEAKASLEKFLKEEDRNAKEAHMVDILSALDEINAKIGKIEITGIIQSAEVRIDGRDVGQTPLSEAVSVDPGVHMVEVSKDGFERFSTEVKVPAGQRIQVKADMAALEPPEGPAADMPPASETGHAVRPKTALPSTADTADSRGRRVMFIAGISALNLAVSGAVAGSIFVFKWNDEYDKTAVLVDLCQENNESTCRDAHKYYSSKLDSDKVGIITGFAASGALIVAGTTLLILHHKLYPKDKMIVGFGPMGMTATF